MLIFLHMHKCAGTTVVRRAKKSGLRLAEDHHNGNLTDVEAGIAVRYFGMGREALQLLLRSQERAGVEFFAIEWDFPRIEHFENGVPVSLFTVLRDPLDRAISNYRYAKLADSAPPKRGFREFMNRSYRVAGPMSRSANYFTRKLCSVEPLRELTPDHLERALVVLERFRSVIILGVDALETELDALGLVGKVKKSKGVKKEGSALRERRPDILDEDLEVNEDDRAWFIEHNRLDIALIERVRERRAERAAAVSAA